MNPLRILAIVIVAACLASGSGVALADDDARDKEEARGLFLEGIKLFDKGKIDPACAKFEAALELFSGIGIRGKLAECYERQGRIASAWRLYKQVSRLARKRGEKKRARVASKRAKKLVKKLPRLIIKTGPSRSLDGFSIQHNLVEMPRRSHNKVTYVDPGSHLIVVSAYEHESWQKKVRLKRGQRRTIVVPKLKPIKRTDDPLADPESTTVDTAAAPSDAGVSNAANAGTVESPAIDRPPGSTSGARITGGTAIGLGALGVGASLYFGLRARSAWQQSEKLCDNAVPCPFISRSFYTTAKNHARWSTISFSAGLTLVAAGALLLWRYRPQPANGRSARVRVAPALASDFMGLSLAGDL